MKTRNFITLFILFFSLQGQAETSDYHLFYSMGPLFSNPGNIRIGGAEWEFGTLGAGYGFNKIIRSQEGMSYLAFGIGSAGIYGGMGLQGNLFWRFNWRLEIASTVGVQASAGGFGLLGFNFYF